MGLPGRARILALSPVIWIQYTNVTDRQTMDTGRQQRPRLRIALHGVITTVAGIRSKFNMTVVDRLSVHELNSEHCAV